jgi:chromosome segregation ATPase
MNTPTPRTDAVWSCFSGYTEPLQDVKDLSHELERELTAAREEVSTINAERADHRGTRKAWIELDDNRQKLEKELQAVTEQRDGLRSGIDYASDQLTTVTKQRDRLADALRECREDSVELLGERCFWQNEPRCDYDKRYKVTRDNVDRADEALQSLTTNETPSK